jgi:hypothetical protein
MEEEKESIKDSIGLNEKSENKGENKVEGGIDNASREKEVGDLKQEILGDFSDLDDEKRNKIFDFMIKRGLLEKKEGVEPKSDIEDIKKQILEAEKAKEAAAKKQKEVDIAAYKEYLTDHSDNIRRLFNNVKDGDGLAKEFDRLELKGNIAILRFLNELGKRYEYNNGVEGANVTRSDKVKSAFGEILERYDAKK